MGNVSKWLIGGAAILMFSTGCLAGAGERALDSESKDKVGYTVTYQHAAAGTESDPILVEKFVGDVHPNFGGDHGGGSPNIGDQQTRTWLSGPNPWGGYQYHEVTDRWQNLNADPYGPPGAGSPPAGWVEIININRPATADDCARVLHVTCKSP